MNMRPSPDALQVRIEQDVPMTLRGGFTCEPGELMALVGPSGAGKTSMLRCLAGLMRPHSGQIRVGSQVWLDTASGVCLSPQQRHVGLVFQHYALMPHLSAIDNVALSLLDRPPAARRQRAVEWLERVRLSPDQQARRPAALSGGQQQRVAVARALAREPAVLLLDEPFSAVDQMNRQSLYDLLAELRASLRIPILLVTHDLTEARQLADHLVVMDGGHVLQEGAPPNIYRSPRNARVADLVGVQNRFLGRWLGPATPSDVAEQQGWLMWLTPSGAETSVRLRVLDKKRLQPGQDVTWIIQADGLLLGTEPQTDQAASGYGMARLEGTVVSVRHLGETTLGQVALRAPEGVTLRITRSGPQRHALNPGQPLEVRLDCHWVHVMPTRTA